jgi:hypothetical protein
MTLNEKMKKYLDSLAVLLASAWVGGLWVIGYIAAPVLFQTLSDKSLAGMLAGRLFAATAYMGMVCAMYLLLYESAKFGRKVLVRSIFRIVVVIKTNVSKASYNTDHEMQKNN